MSSVLGTAEHIMAAAGSLLKDKGDELNELKSLLLQVDQSLCVSQVLLMDTLSNVALSKRQEMLDKSPISESLKETLLFSPLTKNKLFGLALGKLQEEVSKTPQTVAFRNWPYEEGLGKTFRVLQEISYYKFLLYHR
jgi:hypothetical protein